jgi:hypothetical protein
MKKTPILIPFLVFVSALFIGILIWAYIETKKANPQMIEQSAAGRHSTEDSVRLAACPTTA